MSEERKTGLECDSTSPEQYEIRDWCLSLQCSVDELHDAVKAVGPSANAIQNHLLSMRLRRGAG